MSIFKHEYLNAKKTAELLCVSRSQIYALAKRENDPLPGKRVGGTLIFTRTDIEAWVERQPDIQPRLPAHVVTDVGDVITTLER